MICKTCNDSKYVYEITRDALGVVMIILPCPDCDLTQNFDKPPFEYTTPLGIIRVEGNG